MNLYKEVIAREVFPAMGCTEPTAIAYAASIASEAAGEPPEELLIIVNQGTYKNGLAVTIPNTGGETGNLIAGILGCLIAQPERRMEILQEVTPEILESAKDLMQKENFLVKVHPRCPELFIEVQLTTKSHVVVSIIAGSHTNLVFLEKDGTVEVDRRSEILEDRSPTYRDNLRDAALADLLELASRIDNEDREYLKRGIAMNLEISKVGMGLRRVGHYLMDLMEKKLLLDDVFSSTKIMTACAVDARMAGIAMPVMSSGGSGNQGIVATLVPYNVGLHFGIDEAKIQESIALSHLLNAYVKCFTGELAPICGCAIAAGVGAAGGIVYQQSQKDLTAVTFAINNLISDIGGMLCDGAKSGCALKVVSSADAAIRAAYLGIHHHGIATIEGFVGLNAEETIRNLSRITEIGMAKMDETIVDIMIRKSRHDPAIEVRPTP